MNKIDYGLATLDDNQLFGLLPQVVQSLDSGVVLALLSGATSLHNEQIERLRTLPRLVNPDKVYAKHPWELGESNEVFLGWVELWEKTDKSASDRKLLEQLQGSIPKSSKEWLLGGSVLRLLADQFGVELFDQGVSRRNRELIKHAIRLHASRGSPEYYELLSRLAKTQDVKVVGLWSNSTGSVLAKDPERYPYYDRINGMYWRQSGLSGYLSSESVQYPLGSPEYSTNVADGGTEAFTVLVSPRGSLESSYDRVNSLFGKFTARVNSLLVPGVYALSNGGRTVLASAIIPSIDGSNNLFVAGYLGESGNQITLTVEPAGLYQSVTVSGPKSAVKFKSSLVSLLVTGEANPEFETRVLKSLPLTRSVVEKRVGKTNFDSVRYAPYTYETAVVLKAPNGTNWELTVGQDKIPGFVMTSDGSTGRPVIQSEGGIYYKWSINNYGKFTRESTTETTEAVVYVASPGGNGFVFLRNGFLSFSRVPPEELVEEVHGDGRTEAAIFKSLKKVTDLSDDSGIHFQTGPEDSTVANPLFYERCSFHASAELKKPDSGFKAYSSEIKNGQVITNDIRGRFAGIGGGIIEPPGTIYFGERVEFLNYHGRYAWRDRATNVAYITRYLEDGTAVHVAAGGDGPIEGGMADSPIFNFGGISQEGALCTPNSQLVDVIGEWQKVSADGTKEDFKGETLDVGGDIVSSACSGLAIGRELWTSDFDIGEHLGNGVITGIPANKRLYLLYPSLPTCASQSLRLVITSQGEVEWVLINRNNNAQVASGTASGDFEQAIVVQQYSTLALAVRGASHEVIFEFGDQAIPQLAGEAMASGMERDLIELLVLT